MIKIHAKSQVNKDNLFLHSGYLSAQNITSSDCAFFWTLATFLFILISLISTTIFKKKQKGATTTITQKFFTVFSLISMSLLACCLVIIMLAIEHYR